MKDVPQVRTVLKPPRNMVQGGIDTKNKIIVSDCIAHSFHPLSEEEYRLWSASGKDRFWRQCAA